MSPPRSHSHTPPYLIKKGSEAAPSRWWDLPAALLLLIALFAAANRLIATEWVDHLHLTLTLAFLGAVAGLALGQSRFPPSLVAVFALIYGMVAVPWRLGLTLENEILWSDRLIILAGRLSNSLAQLARHEPVQDPLLFLCSMASLFWALSVYAGYTLTRHAHPWRVVLPTGLVLLVIQTSDPYIASRAWYLPVYLAFSLLLLARLTYLRLRVHWQRTDAHVPPLVALDFSYVVLIAAVLLVLLAWVVPVMADVLPDAGEAWRRATRPWAERLDNLFASLRRRGAVVTVTDYYGGSFPLGRGRKLTDALVLTVQSPPGDEPAGVRYYWRARVYDRYADGRWSTAAFSITQIVHPEGLGLTFPELGERRTVTFTFASPEPLATLYAAPQPRWVNRRVKADLAETPDGTVDLAAVHADPPLGAGETYQARSSLSSVTIAQLRSAAAGVDYPEWVTSRYLELPPTITPRTRELAHQIAAEEDTPYDVAVAVTDFLRTYIRYSETITASIPANREPLDWFLFDLREGFCNYYASAEVILLRSVGIPARLAVGFAQGERQAGTNTYLVRQQDAHAWPEVYFPGLGWVEFEPTASQPSIYRSLGESQPDTATSPTAPGDSERSRRDRLERLLALEDELLAGPSGAAAADSRMPVSSRVVLLVLGLTLIALVWRWGRRRGLPPLPLLLEASLRRFDLQPPAFLRRWASRATLTPLERAYMEIGRALARLGAAPAPADTPAERAATLADVLPEAADPAQQLLTEYHAAAYGPRPGNLQVARRSARAVRSLSWLAWIRRLVARR